MIRYYLITAIRNMANRRLYTLVNILGLAIGLTSFILISLYIIDEVSFDKHNQNADRIYRIVNKYDFQGVGEESSSSPAPLAFHLLKEYPDKIETVVRFFNNWTSPYFMTYNDKKFKEYRYFFTDSTVFRVFDIPFIRGNPEEALNPPGSVVITESTAKRYFGQEDPMGKVLKVEDAFSLTVTGIIRDPIPQSHLTYDMLISMSSLRWGGKEPQTWVWNPFWTYVLLKEDVKPGELSEQLPRFVQKYFYDAEKENISLYLQPLTDIHLRSDLDYEIEGNGNIAYIRILGAIAAFLLIIAFINYVNLSTAMAAKRSKEIGIRKVFGSYRKQLILQFITESVVISIIGLVIALAMVEILLPYFNDFTGKNVTSNYFLDPNKMSMLLVITVFTGIIAGIYPALYLSSFHPARILKGIPDRNRTGLNARKILVIVQFTISVALIIGTIFMYRQLAYINRTDLGFRKKDIAYIPVVYNPINRHFDAFKARLLSSPDIVSVTSSDYIIGKDYNTHEFRPEGFPPDQWQFFPALIIDDDFIETFDIKVVAGRAYSMDNPRDAEDGVMINEAMVKHLNWKSNEEALGKNFRTYLGREKVMGVFRDFYASSLHSAPTPLVLSMDKKAYASPDYRKYIVVRYQPGRQHEALSYTEKAWNEFVPDRPFEFVILEQELKGLYHEEVVMNKLSAIFTILVIFIAGLGLYGMASYLADQRTREMGLRRVMGASRFHIAGLLMKELNYLILAAIVIALPLAWLLVHNWLDNFAVRIPIDWMVFAMAGLFALLISTVVSTYKALSAYRVNPAEILRHE
ncbi:MAG TPA: ABC transporter permease [Bacteroidales bacterium]|nr:ABC transporter permease [Bacteroidales bacterium]HRZ20486.1 ABC transporter permease [Bacteroidales bacterium]